MRKVDRHKPYPSSRGSRDTPALIERLVTDLKPVDRGQVEKIVGMGLAFALLASLALMAAWLHPRSDLEAASSTAMFWGKLIYGLTIAGLAGLMTCRLARPACAVSDLWPLVVLPFAAAAIWAAHDLSAAHGADRARLWLGHTWSQCPLLIVTLALPGLAGLLWALRRLAPTNLRLAGLTSGLAAGGAAASVYSLHCQEDSTAFLATWYSLGILATGALGAFLGPRWLRW